MIIDLRSDTVTKPTKQMLEAMFNAKVGDDVFNEDPTIAKLQQKVATLFNMESALFVPSGTMANQIAIKTHTNPCDEVICDFTSHIYNFEGGGIAFHSGASIKTIMGNNGRINSKQVLDCINPVDIHNPQSSLVCLENTSNKGGGSCYDLDEISKINKVCKENNLKLHLDGARVFNAIVEKQYTPESLGELFDSISICLSKGLGAPVGSVLIGSKDFIKQSKRYRKIFGGAMRQAGYLAEAGIYALDNHISRLAEDHRNAKNIVEILKKQSFVKNIMPVETNIIIFELNNNIDDIAFIKKLKEKNILVVSFGKHLIRMVTHIDIKNEMIEILEKELANI